MLPDRKYWKFAQSDLNHASPLNCTAFFGEKILTKNDMQKHLANPLIPNSHHSRCNNQILKSVLVARWSQLFTVQGRQNISDLVQFYSCEKMAKGRLDESLIRRQHRQCVVLSVQTRRWRARWIPAVCQSGEEKKNVGEKKNGSVSTVWQDDR